MKLNKFEIRSREHPPIPNMAPTAYRLWDFFIDGVSLADQVGVEALDGVTSLEYKNADWVLQEFFGKIIPSNQFGTGRLVLYRCHCGCDYCGVISCILQRKGRVITWSNIRQEDVLELSNEFFSSLPEIFCFDFSEYQAEFYKVTTAYQNRPLQSDTR